MKKYIVILLFLSIGFTAHLPCFSRQFDEGVLEELPSTQGLTSNTIRKKQRCKKMCNLWVRNCLRAGKLKVNGNTCIGGDLIVDGTINTNTSTACNFGGGLDGQVLLGVTNGIPIFNFLTSADHSVSFVTGPGSLGMKAMSLYGNVARVDQIYGNDTGPDAGAVNGKSFLTLTAALTAAGAYASPTTPVVVWVFPGIYNEAITIPSNVSLVGLSRGANINGGNVGGVTIQQLAGASPLVTMGTNSLLENVNLQTTGAASVTGISVPTGPATINRITLNVTGGAPATTYGILVSGATVINSSFINSNGLGIYVNAAAAGSMSNSTVTSSGGIGIQTNFAGATFTANASTIKGSTADISQTLGTIKLEDTRLFNSTANGLNFSSTISPTIFAWAATTVLASATPNYMSPGTDAINTTTPSNFGYVIPQQLVVRNLYVRGLTGPGAVVTTLTLYKNGVATALTTSLTGAGLQTNQDTTHSVTCIPGDVLSMQINNPLTSTLANLMVCLEVY